MPAPKLLSSILPLKGALLVSRICKDATEVDICNAADNPQYLFYIIGIVPTSLADNNGISSTVALPVAINEIKWVLSFSLCV